MNKIDLTNYKEVSRPQSQYYYFLQLLKNEDTIKIKELIEKHPGMLNNVYTLLKKNGSFEKNMKRTTVLGDILNLIEEKQQKGESSDSFRRLFEQSIDIAIAKQKKLNIFIDEVEGYITCAGMHASDPYIKTTKSLISKFMDAYSYCDKDTQSTTMTSLRETTKTIGKIIKISTNDKKKDSFYAQREVRIKNFNDETELEPPKERENLFENQIKGKSEGYTDEIMIFIREYVGNIDINEQTRKDILTKGYSYIVLKFFSEQNLNEAIELMNDISFISKIDKKKQILIFKSIAERYKYLAEKSQAKEGKAVEK